MTGRLRVAAYGGVATLAAASALGAVFDGFGWLLPVAGAIAVVVLVSELVRASPLPSALSPLVAAAGLVLYVTATFAGADARVGIVPTGASLSALGDLARAGFHDINALGTPVPTHRGLVLLATVAIAAVALVVDLFAVTMRRAALAGLPLLAVFAVCTSVAKHGAGWVPFVLGAGGYLALLLADSRDRLARWGRPLGFDRASQPRFNWSDTEVTPSPLSVMGRRIGVTAVAIGAVVPLLVPGMHGGVPQSGGGDGPGLGGGSRSAITLNPIVTIRAQLTDGVRRNVLTVASDGDPGYLRLTSLDRFDGTTFAASDLTAPPEAQVSNGIDAPAVTGVPLHSTISVQDLDVRWLPVPQQVQTVSVTGDWRFDAQADTIFSARQTTQGLTYSVTSTTPTPSQAALEQAGAADASTQRYLALPKLPTAVTELAQSVTRSAGTPFDKAVAIQDFLRGPAFTYDLGVSPSDGTDALTEFLTRTRRGFCQQFATAMAVMARVVGIPSRVAVGFTRGEQQPDGRWLVTTKDAHAWPELYFSGVGWLPFEPTPRADGQAVEPAYTRPTSNAGHHGQSGTTKAGGRGGKGGKTAAGVSKNQRLDANADALGAGPKAAAGSAGHGSSGRWVLLWVLAGIVLVALAVPSAARAVGRRRRWRRAVEPAERAVAAWTELRASAIDAGVGWVDGLTPRACARVVRADAGGLATAEQRALDRIVEAVQQAWYSPGGQPRGTDGLEDDVAEIRTALMSECSWVERLRLRLWPRSTLWAARDGVTRLAELLDAADMAGARLRARLGRSRPAAVRRATG